MQLYGYMQQIMHVHSTYNSYITAEWAFTACKNVQHANLWKMFLPGLCLHTNSILHTKFFIFSAYGRYIYCIPDLVFAWVGRILSPSFWSRECAVSPCTACWSSACAPIHTPRQGGEWYRVVYILKDRLILGLRNYELQLLWLLYFTI